MTYYFLVHNSQLVWTRSGNRLAMYDTLATAKQWSGYHTGSYHEDGPYARILRLELTADGPIVNWVPDL